MTVKLIRLVRQGSKNSRWTVKYADGRVESVLISNSLNPYPTQELDTSAILSSSPVSSTPVSQPSVAADVPGNPPVDISTLLVDL